MPRTRPFVLVVAFLGLLLSGCRTYGGYDTEPNTYQAIQTSVHAFESDLHRAETDLQKLETAAANSDTLQSVAEEFRGLLEEHESLLEEQQTRVANLSPDASYRNLHVAYGATITEQRLMRRKYQQTIRNVRSIVQNEGGPAISSISNRQYTIRPVGFPTPRKGKQLSMEQALRGL